MFCITRSVVRWGLISGLALGGVTLLVGPERVAAGLAHVRAKAQGVVDSVSDSPTALRRQVQELAAEYPDRIATVEAEIAEVNHQIGEFEEDCLIARKVVAMTSEDLVELRGLITRAGELDGDRTVFIRFEGVRFDPDEAKDEVLRIKKIRDTYQDREACNRQQLDMLRTQHARLVEIRNKLSDEYATFESQMWQLDRQIDAIERNDRLISMTKQLQATLASYDKWGKVGNLKQVESKLRELATIQESQIRTLERLHRGHGTDYERAAEFEIENENRSSETIEEIDKFLEEAIEQETHSSMAWMHDPVIVE